MRIIVEGFGRRLVDLELLGPLHEPGAAAPPAEALGRDQFGTASSHVEQASEPAPGFGFRGSIATVRALDR